MTIFFAIDKPRPVPCALPKVAKAANNSADISGGDAGAGVLDFRDQKVTLPAEPQLDVAALGHGVGGVVEQIVEDPPQALGHEHHAHFRRRFGHFNAAGAEGEFGAHFLQQVLKKQPVAHRGGHERGVRALGEFQDFVDHLADPIDLFANARLAFPPGLRPAFGHTDQLRREPDDVQRVLEVMDDGAGEPADQRQALGLEHLPDVLPVGFPQAVADHPDEGEGNLRGGFQHFDHDAAREEINDGLGFGDGGGGAGLGLQHGHFPKHFARAHLKQHLGFRLADQHGDLHPAFGHDIKSVADIAFLENDFTRGRGAHVGDGPQTLQFALGKGFKQGAGAKH